jgi:hypothetical protein
MERSALNLASIDTTTITAIGGVAVLIIGAIGAAAVQVINAVNRRADAASVERQAIAGTTGEPKG